MMFYLLSLVTGILECGWIAFGAVHSLPLWQILCYPLAYHVGNLFPKPFSLSDRCLRVMCVLSIAASSLVLLVQLPENVCFILTCCSLFLLSAVIQSVRSGLKSDGNRLMKRTFRVGGFVLAPLAARIPSVLLLAVSVLSLYALRGRSSSYGVTRMTGQNGFSAVMIFHQLHYFFYAHTTLAAVSVMLSKESGLGVLYAALLFAGTWVTYMSVEPLVSRFTSRILPVFYIGHIGIGVLLCLMCFTTLKPLFLALWLVTGFGGGVVYTISARAKAAGSYQKDSMTISENIGHMVGLLTAVCMAAVFGSGSPRLVLLLGAVSAILAVIFMVFFSRKEYQHENICGKSSKRSG